MNIFEILRDAGFLCCRPPHKGSEKKYITYQYISPVYTLYADGRACERVCSWSVDFYTDEPFVLWCDVTTLITALTQDGYTCVVGPELYENDTKLHHIPITVYGVGKEEY